jgi:uncharacterized surface protein with fasciclin (FAS1) repeats
MIRSTLLSALAASTLGTAVIAQTAVAGPTCNHADKSAAGYSGSYRPAIYRLEPGSYGAARAYRMGMDYGAPHGTAAASAATPDIVDTAIAAGSFTTLVTAVQAAGLVETLKGAGPFTVFAPTDAAFAKIPKAQLDALLSNKAALTRVLTYHVVPGKIEAADVVLLTSADTVEGQSLTIKAGDTVMVNNAAVIETDIETSNGVIHVIDAVMLPPDMMSAL